MRATLTGSLTLLFTLACAVVVADDDRKAKIPKLTFVGNYDGEIAWVDLHSDKLTIRIRGVVPKWVPNSGNNNGPAMGALRNFQNRYNQGGGGTYVPEEKVQEISVNLSPDLKVRLVNAPPAPPKDDKPKDGEAKKDGDEKKDDEKDKMEEKKDSARKDSKPAAKKPVTPTKTKAQLAKELREKDPDYQLGGYPGKKTMLAKGQIVRVSMGRNSDPVNPQIYGMVVYVVKDSK
jgi:hypothetical protein